MDSKELLSLMKGRRSIRAFKSDPVPREYVEVILEAGRWAPSSANSQPWDFILVTDQSTREKIHENVLKVIEKIKTLRDFPFLKDFRAEYVVQAPLNIVVCGDPRFTRVSIMDGVDSQIEEFAFWGSVTLPIQNMWLAAHCLGLGAALLTDIYPREIGSVLNVPDPIKVICILVVGFPAESPEPRFRRSISEFTHENSFEAGKMRPDQFVEEARKDPSKLFLKKE